MNHVVEVQQWLRSGSLTGIVVPSTDEFLSEFPPAPNRRLRWVTGFRGSVGLAIILREAAAVFLDGRYIRQAADDVDTSRIQIEPATLEARTAWLKRSLPAGAIIGIDPWLHAATEWMQWRSQAQELGFQLRPLTDNPLDHLWRQGRPAKYEPRVVDFPVAVAGDDLRSKCASLLAHMQERNLEAYLVADPEDVSWLLNVRAAAEAIRVPVGEWQIVPSCTSRALVHRDGRITWFVEPARVDAAVSDRGDEIQIRSPDEILDALRIAASRGTVAADIRRTPAALTQAVEKVGELCADDTIARRRWCKRPAEVRAARRAHVIDAAAVVKFAAWLTRTVPNRTVTEFEAAERLHEFRAEHPEFVAASMPSMSASGLSGAQPHYVPRPHGCRRLNDHPIYWMDSGGQYQGGTTDNTITLALGPPERKHILAHTLLLQGFIALATARAPMGTAAFRLDPLARQALGREGMDYAHGTGHGVGNFLNIHEGPLITRDPSPISAVPLQPGMIVSNEPGYYAAGDFGMRIESHLVVVASSYSNFIEFETISRLPIDPSLVDFNRLSPLERQWLATYHRLVFQDLAPLLDDASTGWLCEQVETFTRAERAIDPAA